MKTKHTAEGEGSRVPRGITERGHARTSAARTPSNGFLSLLRTFGNQTVLRLFESGPIQATLRVSQPGDEVKADHVAEQIVEASDSNISSSVNQLSSRTHVLQRKCACGDSESECDSCRRQKDEAALQPKTGGKPTSNGVPLIVHEALRSPGQPLDADVRAFFEPRFGHDLTHVRLHKDVLAAQSAKAVNASAYTVGSNIVFGAGAFDTTRSSGKQLIAHELTHVLQQAGDTGDPTKVSGPDDPAETQASSVAESLAAFLPSTSQSDDFRIHSRLVQQAGVVARDIAEAEPETDVDEDGDERAEENAPQTRQRYARPRPGSLESILEQMSMEGQRKRAIADAEIPFATLDRGGKAPHFVTFEREQPILTQIGRGGEVLSTKQYAFHILDAIEYSVGFANSNGDLVRILREFIPTLAERMPTDFPVVDLRVVPAFRIPSNLDPDGTIRLRAFYGAVAKRKKQSPTLAREPALDPLETLEAKEPATKNRRRCTIERRRGFLGNDPLATVFCQHATGSLFEYRITSPIYGSVDADAIRGDTMYECKCGYASLLHGLARDKWYAKLQQDKLTEQMLRHQRIVQDCGLRYRYVVSNSELADFLRGVWPSVDIVVSEWEPCD